MPATIINCIAITDKRVLWCAKSCIIGSESLQEGGLRACFGTILTLAQGLYVYVLRMYATTNVMRAFNIHYRQVLESLLQLF